MQFAFNTHEYSRVVLLGKAERGARLVELRRALAEIPNCAGTEEQYPGDRRRGA